MRIFNYFKPKQIVPSDNSEIADLLGPSVLNEANDEGCRNHATIIVNPPSGQLWPEITDRRVELQITGTEMVGTYIFNDTGE